MSVRNSFTLGVLTALVVSAGCGESASQPEATELEVHECSGAGRWFPASANGLRADVEKYLASAKPFESETPIIGLIGPHAGFQYSGPVAGYAYRAVQGRSYSRVVVVAPSHRMIPRNGISVGMYRAFETPLGKVPVDTAVCRDLLEHPSGLFKWVPEAHTPEHSLENHLPFLQVALGEFKLVPLMFGGLGTRDYATVATALEPLLDEDTLFVASTDFTHYGAGYGYMPFPVNDETPAKLEALANRAFGFMKRPDARGFRDFLAETGDTICGRVPVAALLELFENRAVGHVLKYDTFGRMTGGYSQSVSYASLVFTRRARDTGSAQAAKKEAPAEQPVQKEAVEYRELDAQEQATLLKLARRALEAHFELAAKPVLPSAEFPVTPLLEKPLGVFVTLKKNDELRGCIGLIQEGREPLYRSVQEYAVNAAVRDRRFEPMTQDEVGEVHIEISVMRHVDTRSSPFKKCTDPGEIVIGRDGLLVVCGPRQGILLPQVPVEQNWNLDEYLAGICRKAGIPRDALDDPATELYTFSAQVFGE